MKGLTITVDLGKKCAECGKGGAVQNGLCLTCTGKAIRGTPMKSEAGRAVVRRFSALKGVSPRHRKPERRTPSPSDAGPLPPPVNPPKPADAGPAAALLPRCDKTIDMFEETDDRDHHHR